MGGGGGVGVQSLVSCYLFNAYYSKWFEEAIFYEALTACSFLFKTVLYPGVGLGTLRAIFYTNRDYSKHFFRSSKWQKYSILNRASESQSSK